MTKVMGAKNRFSLCVSLLHALLSVLGKHRITSHQCRTEMLEEKSANGFSVYMVSHSIF